MFQCNIILFDFETRKNNEIHYISNTGVGVRNIPRHPVPELTNHFPTGILEKAKTLIIIAYSNQIYHHAPQLYSSDYIKAQCSIANNIVS